MPCLCMQSDHPVLQYDVMFMNAQNRRDCLVYSQPVLGLLPVSLQGRSSATVTMLPMKEGHLFEREDFKTMLLILTVKIFFFFKQKTEKCNV